MRPARFEIDLASDGEPRRNIKARPAVLPHRPLPSFLAQLEPRGMHRQHYRMAVERESKEGAFAQPACEGFPAAKGRRAGNARVSACLDGVVSVLDTAVI